MNRQCEIIAYMVPADYAAGTPRAATMCKTHDWYFGTTPSSIYVVASPTECPMGRIERATDEAIEKIRAERAAKD
ncbi:MAG: hypothetical protein KA472_11385 [Pseudomonadales bacterium]|mgnify:FL=1|nr:hypothetical protein [Pseudomonadales bacterium]